MTRPILNAARGVILRLLLLGLAPLALLHAPHAATADRGSCEAATLLVQPVL